MPSPWSWCCLWRELRCSLRASPLEAHLRRRATFHRDCEGAHSVVAGRRGERRRGRRVRRESQGPGAVRQRAACAGRDRRSGRVLGRVRRPDRPAASGTSWNEVTNVPYDADDPDYRDYYSNSSGGSGLVTGRVTGLAADADGYVYAAGADGGVLAFVHRRRQVEGHRRRAAFALVGRPRDRPGQGALVRDGRGEHRRHELCRAPASTAWRIPGPARSRPPTGSAERSSSRRRSARCGSRDGKVWAATLAASGGTRSATPRRRGTARSRRTRPSCRAASNAERAERRVQEHRQRPRHRPEELEAPARRGRLAVGRLVQRLLRVDRRRRQLDARQHDRRARRDRHRLRELRLLGATARGCT